MSSPSSIQPPSGASPGFYKDLDTGARISGKGSATLSISEKFETGAPLPVRTDFRSWSGLSVTSIYQEIAKGHLRLTKIGNKAVILPADALAWLNSKRVLSA
jgi:hypothetical protein